MSGMKSWSTTASQNVLANTGFTMDENQAPSTLNDSVRQLMADVRTEWAQGASIASAATVDLSTSTGGYVTITGSTGPITSFGTVSAGIRRRLLFTGTPTITYNATSMITPTAASIVVVAGDTCEVMSEGSGNWRVLSYAGQTLQAANLRGPSSLMSPITNSLSGDVAVNNTANFFDGPSVAQGTAGTWYVSGSVTITNGSAAAQPILKLWDGTTVIASCSASMVAIALPMTIHLSGFITSPAANLRISVKDPASTATLIKANQSGIGNKDSTITAIRIA